MIDIKDMEYYNSTPLARLEEGDKAIISVTHFNKSIVKDKDINKYKDVPNGKYESICIEPYYLECKEYPELSGRYNFWYGDKWGCSEGIYAYEYKD